MAININHQENSLNTSNGVLSVDTTGAIVVPAGTTTQRPSATSDGMIRYNNTLGRFEGHSSGVWVSLSSTESNFFSSSQIINNDEVLVDGRNYASLGEVTIADGTVITVDDGAEWTVIPKRLEYYNKRELVYENGTTSLISAFFDALDEGLYVIVLNINGVQRVVDIYYNEDLYVERIQRVDINQHTYVSVTSPSGTSDIYAMLYDDDTSQFLVAPVIEKVYHLI